MPESIAAVLGLDVLDDPFLRVAHLGALDLVAMHPRRFRCDHRQVADPDTDRPVEDDHALAEIRQRGDVGRRD